jgi:hypothetical protein
MCVYAFIGDEYRTCIEHVRASVLYCDLQKKDISFMCSIFK